MPQPPELTILVTTFAGEANATAAVRTLVGEKLAACGTLFHQARSIYAWQDRIEDAAEILVWIKTTPERAAAAGARLKEIHPYECPEILVLPAQSLNPDYSAWVIEQTTEGARDTET
jgi:periplasmic divalent cation tolerance protein